MATTAPTTKLASLQDVIEQERGRIWVINTSDQHASTNSKGDVYVTVHRADGNATTLTVPVTWLPIDVTKTVTRKSILESSYFLDALHKKLLTLVTEEYALSLLERSDAAREQKRLDEREAIALQETKARGIGKNVTITTGDLEQDEEIARRDQAEKASINPSDFDSNEAAVFEDIDTSFKAFVNKSNSLSEPEAIDEFRNHGRMSMEQAAYMKEKTVHRKIRAFLERSV